MITRIVRNRQDTLWPLRYRWEVWTTRAPRTMDERISFPYEGEGDFGYAGTLRGARRQIKRARRRLAHPPLAIVNTVVETGGEA